MAVGKFLIPMSKARPTYIRKITEQKKQYTLSQDDCDALVKLSGVNASTKEFPFTISVVAITNFRPDIDSVISFLATMNPRTSQVFSHPSYSRDFCVGTATKEENDSRSVLLLW